MKAETFDLSKLLRRDPSLSQPPSQMPRALLSQSWYRNRGTAFVLRWLSSSRWRDLRHLRWLHILCQDRVLYLALLLILQRTDTVVRVLVSSLSVSGGGIPSLNF